MSVCGKPVAVVPGVGAEGFDACALPERHQGQCDPAPSEFAQPAHKAMGPVGLWVVTVEPDNEDGHRHIYRPAWMNRYHAVQWALGEYRSARKIPAAERLFGVSAVARTTTEHEIYERERVRAIAATERWAGSEKTGAAGSVTVHATFERTTPRLAKVTLELDGVAAAALYTTVNDRIGPTGDINPFYGALLDLGVALRRAGVKSYNDDPDVHTNR